MYAAYASFVAYSLAFLETLSLALSSTFFLPFLLNIGVNIHKISMIMFDIAESVSLPLVLLHGQ